MASSLDKVLATVGPRLRALRQQRDLTLADLSAATGISASTLSRLESGQRRPNLELLLPLAQAYRVPLDELIGAPAAGDPRIHAQPFTRNGMTVLPLTRRTEGLQAYKLVIPTSRARQEPDLQVHEDLLLRAGEAAEFDTRVPHWFGRAGAEPVELLSLFGPQGERMHVRARPTKG